MIDVIIQGERYFSCEVPAIGRKGMDDVNNLIKRFDCIFSGFDIIKGGIFTPTVFKIKVLVPERNVREFCNFEKQH